MPEVAGLAERLGYRYPRPRAFQRLVQAFAGSRVGAWATPKTLVPLDRLMTWASSGRVSLPALLAGLPVVSVTSTGRRSGLPRRTHLIAIPYDDTLALIGTNFGQPATPAWTLNLKTNPVATVAYHGRMVTVLARTATPEERARILTLAAAKFAGAAKYEARVQDKRQVDVFVLREQP